MTRFEATIEKHHEQTVYVLRDLQSGAAARIVPALGANCMELKLPAEAGGAPVAVIDDLKFIPKLVDQPSRYGIPILFPWPSGIAGNAFEFENKVYQLHGPDERKSTHHGFVNTAAWSVVRSDCDNSGAWLTCQIDSRSCSGSLAQRFPFPFLLQVTWRLTLDGFRMQMQARNTGDQPMPMGFGLHPYFTIPFGKNGARETCRLAADVGRQWDLDDTFEVKPGDQKPAKPFLPQPEFNAAPESGSELSDTKFNHVFEAGFPAGNSTSASVIDLANDVKLTISGSPDFNTWVFYTPPDRNAISLEPWTLTPNGFNLAAAGLENTGLIILQVQQEWTGEVRISVSPYRD